MLLSITVPLIVLGCDLLTGPPGTDILWSIEGYGGTVGTPYVDDELIVAGVAFSDRVFAADRTTGDVLWEATLELPVLLGEPQLSPRTEIFGFQDLIIVVSDWIHALDRHTGHVEWSLTPADHLVGRAGAVLAGDRLIGTGDRIFVIDAANGEVDAELYVGEYPFHPAFEDGVLYFGARAPGEPTASGVPLGEGHAMALEIETGMILWRHFIPNHPTLSWVGGVVHRGALTQAQFIVASPNGHVYGLDRSTGRPVWVHEGRSPYGDVQIIGGVAVVGGNDGAVQGLDVRTGDVLWTDTKYGSSITGIGSFDDFAFVAAGRIRAFDPTGTEVWGFGGAGWNEPIFTRAPIVLDGVLYANSIESGLFAVPFPL